MNDQRPGAWQHVKAPAVFLYGLWRYVMGLSDEQDFRDRLNRARAMTGREPV
jgi:hypothetical protein